MNDVTLQDMTMRFINGIKMTFYQITVEVTSKE